MSMREDALALLAAELPDGPALLAALALPFRRSIRLHPLRGTPTGWGELTAVPWHGAGRFTVGSADPAGFLDYHTGLAYPQDAASQVPVLLLAPRPGEVVVDACAAPGSKSTQIGLALGDSGLLICCDASAPRRAVLTENLARQGVACALVTPLPVHALAERHGGCADALLVDAPCSGHESRSPRQVARMAERQLALLTAAAPLVRAGGRLVYSTCTPYREEDEGVIAAFLAAHPQWRAEAVALPGIDADLAGLGALRLWPQRQGTEPFFACRLVRAEAPPAALPLAGVLPAGDPALGQWLPGSTLHTWRRGNALLAATPLVAACALPAEARGLLLGHGSGAGFHLEPWAAQALITRGAPAQIIAHAQACRLWAGETGALIGKAGDLIRTDQGAPLGILGGLAGDTRLVMPSRMRRSGLR